MKVSSQNLLSDQEKDLCAELYLSRMTIKSISKQQNFPILSVYNALKSRKVKIKKNLYRKNTFNENYFDIIDTEEKAYFLGYLWADGYNVINPKTRHYIVGMELQERDSIVLEKLSKAINFSGSISIKKKSKDSHQDHSIIRLGSKTFCYKLNDIGMTPRKSLTCSFPERRIVPENLIRHFIRGYFDGDGCITLGQNDNLKCIILGSKFFLDTLSEIISSIGCYKPSVLLKQKGKIHKIELGGNSNVILFFDWIYRNSSIFLDRKRKVFLDFLTLYKNKNFKMSNSKLKINRDEIINHYANL